MSIDARPQDERIADLLTPKDLERELGIPAATWRWYRHVGRGPTSFKLGGRRIVYRRADVEQWLAEQYAEAR